MRIPPLCARALVLICLLLGSCGGGDQFTPSATPAGNEPPPASPLSIAAVVPSRGLSAGGESIEIHGVGFENGALSARLGGVALLELVVLDGTSIKAVTPPGLPGLATLEIVQGEERVFSVDAFEYEPPPLPPALFLADGRGGVPGSLYRLDLNTEVLETVGELPVALTGLAEGPHGGLWGVEATKRGALGDSRLVWVDPIPDPESGDLHVQYIGTLLDVDTRRVHQSISDITLVGDRLIGWTQDGDRACEIDTETGAVTSFDGSVSTFGGGLAFDGRAQVWLAPAGSSGSLYGYAEDVDAVVEQSQLSNASLESGSIGAMTYVGDRLLALEMSGQGVPTRVTHLISIEPGTGVITMLRELPASVAAIAKGTD